MLTSLLSANAGRVQMLDRPRKGRIPGFMAELSKDLVGTKLEAFSIDVERGKIKEFCQAIGETNPIYTDVAAAKEAGYEDTPAPPTFQTSFAFWGVGFDEFWEGLGKLGIDTTRLLHMKEEYEYVKPLYPGMTIHSQAEIVDVKIGKMNMVTMRNEYKDDKGEVCIKADMAIVIRPEGK